MSYLRLSLAALVPVLLSGCAQVYVGNHLLKKADSAECAAEGYLKVGNPYIVDGVRYVPMNESLGYSEKGIASWYGQDFHGKVSANGECYNMYAFTAAHKSLPLPTIARVTNLENGKSVVVKVNDRGPFVRGRIIDLSYAAAQSLDMVRFGTAPVLVEAIGGPHHQRGGYKGGYFNAAEDMKKNDIRAERLASVGVGGGAEEESLAPLPKGDQHRSVQPPKPAVSLPKPPEYEDRVFTDTKPLKKTFVYVQIGAYSSEANATEQMKKLAETFDTAALSQFEAGGKQLLRVRAGPFHSVADADAALQKAISAGFTEAQLKVDD
ncbi:MAG: septal ring lytic transglycosylase RlpA family protein [Blastochloris viridis]|uniref:Endolytic peptidoglycan transglycosylase RlpA n=1 Tax=Blastochloris viridis TaxID=1079 RepID=A0A6N4RDX4_BLAVI|nr:MAG: septal ring lytic transglycosylase RlpA family protein [Blastochloris viridis]